MSLENYIKYQPLGENAFYSQYCTQIYKGDFHTGADLVGQFGKKDFRVTPLYAVFDGVVKFADWGHGSGNTIILKSKDYQNKKVIAVYAHCENMDVEQGDEVKAGEKIGYMGNTGKSTAAHLHFNLNVFEIEADMVDIHSWSRKNHVNPFLHGLECYNV